MPERATPVRSAADVRSRRRLARRSVAADRAPYALLVSALDEFASLMKEHVGPRLRAWGWSGSGANWVRPHPAQWVLLGWQKDKYSNSASVSFTANLKVISKEAWDAENVPRGRVPAKPPASTTWHLGWEERLGGLTPGSGGDRWWYVRPGDDLPVIAAEVLGALSTYGLPAIERVLIAAESAPPTCWHNVGGHNWFEACGRPADVPVHRRDRVLFRCAEHADLA